MRGATNLKRRRSRLSQRFACAAIKPTYVVLAATVSSCFILVYDILLNLITHFSLYELATLLFFVSCFLLLPNANGVWLLTNKGLLTYLLICEGPSTQQAGTDNVKYTMYHIIMISLIILTMCWRMSLAQLRIRPAPTRSLVIVSDVTGDDVIDDVTDDALFLAASPPRPPLQL